MRPVCMYNGCNRQRFEKGEYCIFHDPDAWRRSPEPFRKALREHLKRGDFTFTGFNFPDVNFGEVRFSKVVKFDMAVFHGTANFSGAIFEKMADFIKATFEGRAIFRGVEIQIVDFSEARFLDLIDIRETNLSNLVLSKIDASRARLLLDWPKDFRIRDEIIARQSSSSEQASYLIDIAKSYKALRHAALNEGNYDNAGELYYREMICRKDAHKQAYITAWKESRFFSFLFRRKSVEDQQGFSFWKHFFQWFYLWWFDLLCGFGEKPKKTLYCSFVIFLIFSFIYFVDLGKLSLQVASPCGGMFWERLSHDLLTSLFLSADSFTGLGIGNYEKLSDTARGFAPLETLLGILMTSIFLVVFTRKMTRE